MFDGTGAELLSIYSTSHASSTTCCLESIMERIRAIFDLHLMDLLDWEGRVN
jgi:hypothetical protein